MPGTDGRPPTDAPRATYPPPKICALLSDAAGRKSGTLRPPSWGEHTPTDGTGWDRMGPDGTGWDRMGPAFGWVPPPGDLTAVAFSFRSAQVAWVTRSGQSELESPIAVRERAAQPGRGGPLRAGPQQLLPPPHNSPIYSRIAHPRPTQARAANCAAADPIGLADPAEPNGRTSMTGCERIRAESKVLNKAEFISRAESSGGMRTRLRCAPPARR